MRQENATAPWDRRTVVLVDEMAMLSAKDTDRLLSHARATGAKIVGFGDERQLASIERGGLFGPLAEQAQAKELTTVTRQLEDWQRLASEAAARGDFKDSIGAYAERGAIRWTETVEDAFKEVRNRWTDEQAAGRSAFVYATTNDSVDRLNGELRAARIDLGQVSREGERTFTTEKGERRIETTISPGDRIQFHATVKDRAEGLELHNGTFGTVLGIEGDRLRVHMDDGRLVAFDAAKRRGWGLGYAGTTYKGQGKTNEATILFYDNARAWSSRAAYVNLTRHKSQAHLVVPSELAPSRKELAQQMSRDDGRRAAVTYRRAPERPALERAAPAMPPQGEKLRRATSQPRPATPPAVPEAGALERIKRPPMVAGRLLDEADMKRAVAARALNSHGVRNELQQMRNRAERAFTDPKAGEALQKELVKGLRLPRAEYEAFARSLVKDTEHLGGLKGKVGLLVGKASKAERADAIEQQKFTEQAALGLKTAFDQSHAYEWQGEKARRERMAVEVPSLSPEGRASLERLASKNRQEAEQERHSISANPELEKEVLGFVRATGDRFGGQGAIGEKGVEYHLAPDQKPTPDELKLINAARLEHNRLDGGKLTYGEAIRRDEERERYIQRSRDLGLER
jgi:hypothetical protein